MPLRAGAQRQGRSVRGTCDHTMGVARWSFNDLCEQPMAAARLYSRYANGITHSPHRPHHGDEVRKQRNEDESASYPDRHTFKTCGKSSLGRRPSPTRSAPRDGYEAQEFRRHGVTPDRDALGRLIWLLRYATGQD